MRYKRSVLRGVTLVRPRYFFFLLERYCNFGAVVYDCVLVKFQASPAMKRSRNSAAVNIDEADGNTEAKSPKHTSTLKGDNPLAQARGVNKKKDDKAWQLWHRKSGAGYRLFVLYYLKQAEYLLPEEIATASDVAKTTQLEKLLALASPTRESSNRSANKSSSPIKQSQLQGSGQSRAAKRRKRKRQKDGKGEASAQDSPKEKNDVDTEQSATHKDAEVDRLSSDGRRLLQAISQISNDPETTVEDLTSILSFFHSLAMPLPLTFRIRRGLSSQQTNQLRSQIQKEFGSMVQLLPFETDSIYRAKLVPGAPVLSKNILNHAAPELKEWLVENTTTQGNIARQELGSMLPVVLLAAADAIQDGSRVLDLCASPGSKTLQALEVVGAQGRIKANDINASRLQSLQEAIQRANMPSSHRIKFINVDASKYPIPVNETRLFDTIICDVPCSGDGTIRKDAHILPNWTPQTSNALHGLQTQILVRALQCLKPGGIMCFSTCSINPIENEAVVASALEQVQKLKRPSIEVKLVPIPETNGVKLRPGVKHWKVADYRFDDIDTGEGGNEAASLRWYETYEDAVAGLMEHATPTLWSRKEDEFNLEHCGRLWPHDNECGGFFVALLQRVS